MAGVIDRERLGELLRDGASNKAAAKAMGCSQKVARLHRERLGLPPWSGPIGRPARPAKPVPPCALCGDPAGRAKKATGRPERLRLDGVEGMACRKCYDDRRNGARAEARARARAEHAAARPAPAEVPRSKLAPKPYEDDPAWPARFRELAASGLPTKAIARVLGLHPDTIQKKARRLGLTIAAARRESGSRGRARAIPADPRPSRWAIDAEAGTVAALRECWRKDTKGGREWARPWRWTAREAAR